MGVGIGLTPFSLDPLLGWRGKHDMSDLPGYPTLPKKTPPARVFTTSNDPAYTIHHPEGDPQAECLVYALLRKVTGPSGHLGLADTQARRICLDH